MKHSGTLLYLPFSEKCFILNFDFSSLRFLSFCAYLCMGDLWVVQFNSLSAMPVFRVVLQNGADRVRTADQTVL